MQFRLSRPKLNSVALQWFVLLFPCVFSAKSPSGAELGRSDQAILFGLDLLCGEEVTDVDADNSGALACRTPKSFRGSMEAHAVLGHSLGSVAMGNGLKQETMALGSSPSALLAIDISLLKCSWRPPLDAVGELAAGSRKKWKPPGDVGAVDAGLGRRLVPRPFGDSG